MENEWLTRKERAVLKRLGYSLAERITRKEVKRIMVELSKVERTKLLHGWPIKVGKVARIYLLPVAKGKKSEGYGTSIEFEARLHKDGLMGPLEVTKENIMGCYVSAEEAEGLVTQANESIATLQEHFPVLIPTVQDLRVMIESEIKAIEAETKKIKAGE